MYYSFQGRGLWFINLTEFAALTIAHTLPNIHHPDTPSLLSPSTPANLFFIGLLAIILCMCFFGDYKYTSLAYHHLTSSNTGSHCLWYKIFATVYFISLLSFLLLLSYILLRHVLSTPQYLVIKQPALFLKF